MKVESTQKNLSVGRVFQIIEAMAESKGPMRLQDISSQLSLSASTVLRFLNALIECQYVQQNSETLRYSLTMKFCHIGHLVSSQYSIRDVVRPFLVEVAEQCRESSCLAVGQDNMVVYIDVVEGPESILQTLQRIGKRAPLHTTGVGKNLLLNFDERSLNHLIEEKGLTALTKHTITTKDELLAELETIRSRGYAIDDEECENGVRCVAAPIRDYTGKIVASISVSGPVSRMTFKKLDLSKDYVTAASTKISRQLGFE